MRPLLVEAQLSRALQVPAPDPDLVLQIRALQEQMVVHVDEAGRIFRPLGVAGNPETRRRSPAQHGRSILAIENPRAFAAPALRRIDHERALAQGHPR